MKSPYIRLGSIMASAALLSSCATIVSGTHQEVKFSSNPSGASVSIDGTPDGQTPLDINLSTKIPHSVVINLPGYAPYTVLIQQTQNGWVWGNLLFGGIIGVIIDSSDGAIYGLTPADVSAQLTKAEVTPDKKRGACLGRHTIYIGAVLKADPHWVKLGQLARWDRIADN